MPIRAWISFRVALSYVRVFESLFAGFCVLRAAANALCLFAFFCESG
jgi:hypothetical protein